MSRDKDKDLPEPNKHAFDSDAFYLDTVQVEPAINTITKDDGCARKISSRQMSALTTLAMNFGEVVSRAEMHQILCLSKEGMRDRAALSHHIGKIRKELGDTGRDSKFIKTVRGGGYYLLVEPKFDAPVTWKDSPYRGLKPYRFEHAPIFFGRSGEISKVVDALEKKQRQGHSMLWVSGASGVGKSSLIEAGVLPRLKADCQKTQQKFKHLVFCYRSGMGELFEDFADLLAATFPKTFEDGETAAQLAAVLSSNPQSAGERIEQILSAASRAAEKDQATNKQPEYTLVMIIDQVDELFASQRISSNELELLFHALVSISRAANCVVIGSVRLDYLPQCLNSKALGSDLLDSGLHILKKPMIAELREIILSPANLKKLSFEVDDDGLSLCDVLIQDTLPNIESLPILGFTLEVLFRNCQNNVITFKQYQQVGGIEGCLAGHCDREYLALPMKAQKCLGGVLSHLTTSSVEPSLTISAKPAPWREVAYSNSAESLINAFLRARILTVANDQNGTRIVRLAHEAVLSSWHCAKLWVDDNFDLIRIKTKLAVDANNWEEGAFDKSFLLPAGLRLAQAKNLLSSGVELSDPQRDFIVSSLAEQTQREKRQDQLRYKIAASAVIFALLSMVTSGLGYRYWQELETTTQLKDAAERASQLATIEREVAESTSELMIETFSFSTPENKKGLVLSARELLDRKLERIETNSEIDPALRATHLAALGRAYFGLNEHAIGVDLLERSLAILRMAESPDQLQLARTLTILAESISTQTHNPSRAKPYLFEAINIFSHYPSSVLQLSKTFEVLAGVQQLENDLEGAERTLKQALIELCHRVPNTNRQVKSLRVKLGRNLALQSKFVQAESISREVLRSDRVELAADDPQLVNSISQYAYYLYHVGKFEQAIEYYREALSIQKENYAQDHWRVAQSKGRLGHLLVQHGQHQEAELMLAEAIESEINANGPQTIAVGVYKVSLADSLVKSGSAQLAKSHVLDAISIINRKEGPTAGLMLIANSVLGASLVELGECESGVKLMQDAHTAMRDNRGDLSPYTVEMQRRLTQFKGEKVCSV